MASQSVPRWRISAASPLSSLRPSVSPGSKSLSLKPLPLVMRNGWTYFWMRSRISFLAMVQFSFRSLYAARLRINTRSPTGLDGRDGTLQRFRGANDELFRLDDEEEHQSAGKKPRPHPERDGFIAEHR